eukprot:g3223.t1
MATKSEDISIKEIENELEGVEVKLLNLVREEEVSADKMKKKIEEVKRHHKLLMLKDLKELLWKSEFKKRVKRFASLPDIKAYTNKPIPSGKMANLFYREFCDGKPNKPEWNSFLDEAIANGYVKKIRGKGPELNIQFEDPFWNITGNVEDKTKYIGKNLYIWNISDAATEESLSERFKKYGIVKSCRIMKDKNDRSRGFGFVCMSTRDEANRAIESMNNAMFHDKPLYVSLWKPRKTSTTTTTNVTRSNSVTSSGTATNPPAFDIFISYRRSRVAEARLLKNTLERLGSFNVFLDVVRDDGLSVGDFQSQLESVLRDTPVVIVMVTPLPSGPDESSKGGFDRSRLSSMAHIKAYANKEWTDWCRLEMATAVKMNKIIVPVYPGVQGGAFLGKELEHLKGLADVDSIRGMMGYPWHDGMYDESVKKIVDGIKEALAKKEDLHQQLFNECRHHGGERRPSKVAELLKKGADPIKIADEDGMTALHYLVVKSKKEPNALKCLELVLEDRRTTSKTLATKTRFGSTALHYAAYSLKDEGKTYSTNAETCLTTLIKKMDREDIEQFDKNGQMAIDMVSSRYYNHFPRMIHDDDDDEKIEKKVKTLASLPDFDEYTNQPIPSGKVAACFYREFCDGKRNKRKWRSFLYRTIGKGYVKKVPGTAGPELNIQFDECVLAAASKGDAQDGPSDGCRIS